jgi:hypothetical protein
MFLSAHPGIQPTGSRVPYTGTVSTQRRGRLVFMRDKKTPELTYSDVTPKGIYMGRRNFLLGIAATYGAVVGYKKFNRILEGPSTGSTPVKLPSFTKWPYRKRDPSRGRHPLQ